MRTSDKGICALIQHEGIVPGPYKDSVGVWTYGIGHTAAAGAPDPSNMDRGTPATLDDELMFIFDIFRDDLKKYEADVSKAFKSSLAQHQFDAAVSFHYNTGSISTATWVKTFNGGNPDKAADQIMNWSKPDEIIPRRKAEQTLFRDGIYSDGIITVWGVSDKGKVKWTPMRTLSNQEALGLMD